MDLTQLRPIPGFEGLYSASQDGRIWSHERKHGRGVHPGRWLRPGRMRNGYLMVILHRNGKAKNMTVHRAIALTWVPNSSPETRIEINHISGIKSENQASNLAWCTRSENLTHAHRTGLRPKTHRKQLKVKNAI